MQPHLEESDQDAQSINLGSLAFQIRYRREIAPLSNIYLVYTRGGSVFLMTKQGIRESFQIHGMSLNRFAAKIRYRF